MKTITKTVTLSIFLMFTVTLSAQTKNKPMKVSYKGRTPDITDFARAYLKEKKNLADVEREMIDEIKNEGRPKPKREFPSTSSFIVDRANGYIHYTNGGDPAQGVEICFWNSSGSKSKIVAVNSFDAGAISFSTIDFYRYDNQTKMMSFINPPFDRPLVLEDYFVVQKLSKKQIDAAKNRNTYGDDSLNVRFSLPRKGADIEVSAEIVLQEGGETATRAERAGTLLKWNGNGFTVVRGR